MNMPSKPQYGNWVAPRMIRACVILAAILLIVEGELWIFADGQAALTIIVGVLAAFFIACVVYFRHARRLFSPEGGDIQNKVLDLLVSHIDWDGKGKALDIGCGSGALAVKIAKRFPQAHITGLDFWGADWNYAKAQCETNTALESVETQTDFVQGSATALPFADGTFDLTVSNMTFHEVKDAKNKIDLIKEALRVLKPGGAFVFQDLFLLKAYYGAPDELVAAVKAMGAKEVQFENTSNAPFIPTALKLPFMLGAAGVLRGRKI